MTSNVVDDWGALSSLEASLDHSSRFITTTNLRQELPLVPLFGHIHLGAALRVYLTKVKYSRSIWELIWGPVLITPQFATPLL